MSEYLTDQEQVEMIKKWWNDYGKSLAIAVIIGLAVGFGWHYWRQHQSQMAQNASGIYQAFNMAFSTNDNISMQQYSQQLIQQYPKTPYASMAALQLAKHAAQNNNTPGAVTLLQWVIDNGKIKSLQQIARIREARIFLANNEPQSALQVLSVVVDPAYRPLIDSAKGDIYFKLGKSLVAQRFYQSARRGLLGIGVEDPLLTMKMAQM